MNEVEPDRLLLLRHCVPSIGTAAVPRDVFAGQRFPAVFDTKVQPMAEELGEWHCISLVNWRDAAQTVNVRLDRNLFGDFAAPGDTLLVSAFRSRRLYRLAYGETVAVESIPAHGCEVLKVQHAPGRQPALVLSDGHFSMGGVEIVSWAVVRRTLCFTVRRQWPVDLNLTILPPAGEAFAEHETDAPARVTVRADADKIAHLELAFAE